MKNIIILSLLSLIIFIPIGIFVIDLNESMDINYKVGNDIYIIYLSGEVSYKGEIEVKKGTILKEFIYDYITKNSDLDSFDDSLEVINNHLYYIGYKDKLSINDCSLADLKKLTDIGDVRAKAIIEGRPYLKIEELLEKGILTSGIYDKIKNDISI